MLTATMGWEWSGPILVTAVDSTHLWLTTQHRISSIAMTVPKDSPKSVWSRARVSALTVRNRAVWAWRSATICTADGSPFLSLTSLTNTTPYIATMETMNSPTYR